MKGFSLKAVLLSLVIVFTSSAYGSSIVTSATDTVNSGIINTKMIGDDMLNGSEIDATVINGVAVFSGRVNSKAQIKELIRIARSVSGVKGVNVSRVRIVGR